MKVKDLICFEEDIFKKYESGLIKNPIHLSGTGNEKALIKIFKKINKKDWVFSTHRNHYHALLKSNNKEWTKKQVIKSSMHINSKKYKIFTSSIVGGNLPIALGVALALKIKKSKSKVYCFTGDMGSRMGIFSECRNYAAGHNLPIEFIIEDNGLGVLTPTRETWGTCGTNMCTTIKYERYYPHHGIGKWINF
ncbi:MAG: thiamine pyrophosphate-dependent enzyme [Promethearchaeota archaeon]